MECLIHIFQIYGSSYRNKITHEAFMQAKSLNNVCLQRETHLQLIQEKTTNHSLQICERI